MIELIIEWMNIHGAVEIGFRNVESGFHDLVEAVIGHVSGDKQLGRRHVVQYQRLDARHVHPHFAVDSRTFDADYHPEVGRQPRRIWNTNTGISM